MKIEEKTKMNLFYENNLFHYYFHFLCAEFEIFLIILHSSSFFNLLCFSIESNYKNSINRFESTCIISNTHL